MFNKHFLFTFLFLIFSGWYSSLIGQTSVVVAGGVTGSACVSQLGVAYNYIINTSAFPEYSNSGYYANVNFLWSTEGGNFIVIGTTEITVNWNSLPGKVKILIQYQECQQDENGNCNNNTIYQEYSELAVNPESTVFSNIIASTTGSTLYNYTQTPATLSDINQVSYSGSCTPPVFQWESSDGLYGNYTPIAGAANAQLNFTQHLDNTTYYRRVISAPDGYKSYSNIIKIEIVGIMDENLNYIREETVLMPGIKNWRDVDALPIGQKLQMTTYLDALGRPIEKISRETSTPASTTSAWGDIVQFKKYDGVGRETRQYLPYPASTQIGSFKTNTENEQSTYYQSNYNETSPYSEITQYDNSPTNRPLIVKESGDAWMASSGNKIIYSLNDASDAVRIFAISQEGGSFPTNLNANTSDQGSYHRNQLYKTSTIDEKGRRLLTYINKSGQTILTKVAIDDNPAGFHEGWICTYNVYDDYNRLRYVITPEAVKYFDTHSWILSSPEALQVFQGLCFHYEYDQKGRTILKKSPDAREILMIYDSRNRLVFTQDGNQFNKYPNTAFHEWTANLYDEQDRLVITTLYKTDKTVAQLQSDIDNSVTVNNVSVVNTSNAIIDLSLHSRDASIPLYTAQHSIEFIDADANGFFQSAATDDEFTAEINETAGNTNTIVQVAIFHNPIADVQLNDPASCTILKYLYYDYYTFIGNEPFNNDFQAKMPDPGTSDVQSAVVNFRTLGMPTGSRVRVLGSNNFLANTIFYNDNGMPLQTIVSNLLNSKDVNTVQYGWNSRVLATHISHTVPGTAYLHFSILTRNQFDKIGRIISIEETFGNNSPKQIASYVYDAMGRIKTKTLAPGQGYINPTNNNSFLESLDFSYNIHGKLTAINKDYALNFQAGSDKWKHYFGQYLGYENNRDGMSWDNGGLLTGQISGQLWKTQGDDYQRKYEYEYDNTGRFVKAIFKQNAGINDTWNNNKIDVSVGGNGGVNQDQISYDLNGNLLNMQQKGVQIGIASPQTVDDLSYTYKQFSNQLISVHDNGNLTSPGFTNGSQGDFKDGNNTTDDYLYDDNGNLILDLNKDILTKDLPNVVKKGVVYNYLDKPEEINLFGKGIVRILYDADGRKLQRSFTSEISHTTKTTTYIDQFTYEETISTTSGTHIQPLTLTNIRTPEGRLRIIKNVDISTSDSHGALLDLLSIKGSSINMPDGNEGVFDYYISDNLGNARMILTEELHATTATCSMETNDPATGRDIFEEGMFGQSGINNEVGGSALGTRFLTADIPGASWQGNSSLQVSKLGLWGTGVSKVVGPNQLLKVMAGDEISATAQYYYKEPLDNANVGSSQFIASVLTSLAQSLAGGALPAHGSASGVQTNLAIPGDFTSLIDLADPNSTLIPKAGLTIAFFDERFNFIEDGSFTDFITEEGKNSNGSTLGLDHLQIKAPRNGYCYIYLSNKSNEPVYFDNLRVHHDRSRIIEENHYYAYGLKIATLSSRKLPDVSEGAIENRFGYQGSYNEFDDDLQWNEFSLRSYDPQIGRWLQVDPLNQYPSGYAGMGLDPINLVDPSGGGTNDGILEGTSQDVTVIGHLPEFGEAQNLLDILQLSVNNDVFWKGKSQAYLYRHDDGKTSWRDILIEGTFCDGGRTITYIGSAELKATDEVEDEKADEYLQDIIPDYGRLRGFLSAASDALWGIASIFNPDENQNTVINAGKGLYAWAGMSDVQRGLTAYKIVSNTDFTKPSTQGAILFNVATLVVGAGEVGVASKVTLIEDAVVATEMVAAKGGATALEQTAVHGNSLLSTKPTWGYKLYSNDGAFLKNGITNKLIPETRYTKSFMSDKYMEAIPFPNRLGAYQWEFGQNQILRGPLNFNMH